MTYCDKLRMIEWALAAAMFYSLAMLVGSDYPQLQTGLWKAGHITSGAFLGYWIDRKLNMRITETPTVGRLAVRAWIVAAAIIGMAFGL